MNQLPAGLDALIPGFPKLPTGGAGDKKAPFELAAGPFVSHELRVVSFHGCERINDIFQYDVTFATDVPEELLYPAIDGEPASLTIKAPGHEPRIIQGIASAFEPLGHLRAQHGPKLLAYNLTIVPKLWLLRNQMRNRAFQDRTPRQIVEEILAASNIGPKDCRWRVRPSDYRPLPFVLQRDESDYDFFRRILAEQGIYFYFEHASGLADQLLPGAGGIANALGSVADLVGGPVADAVDEAGAAAKMRTILNFGDEPGHTPAVAAMAVVNQAIGAGLRKVASQFGGDEAAKLVDEEPCDTLTVDDGKSGNVDQERVYKFGLRKEIRPKSVRLIEWDVGGSRSWEAAAEMKPVVPSARAKVGLSMGPDGPSLKASASLGLEIDSPTLKAKQLCEDYYQLDTNLRAYANPSKRAERELERRRRDYLVGRGESDCRRLGAAYRFRLGGHPVAALDIEYTVTELVSDGVHPDFTSDQAPLYRNTFECIPSTVAPRPPRPDKRPKLGLEIATVVDAGGQNVSPILRTDECAYVHVRFKWDIYDEPRVRDGIALRNDAEPDSHTVIQVPVMQPWAGDGFGCQFIPREGMDVLIGFLGGQGERPVVLGCLYSQRNSLPVQDAIKHQRVGIVTQTRPTNGNWSEVTIDDHQGQEVVKVRAAKDLEEEVLHDHRSRVDNDRVAEILGSDSLAVTKDWSVAVAGSVTETAEGDRSTSTGGTLSETVGGNRVTTTTGRATNIVLGRREEHTAGEWQQFAGSHAAIIEGDSSLSVKGAYRQTVGDPNDEASTDMIANGSYSVVASRRITLRAGEAIVAEVGSTRIELREDALVAIAKALGVTGESVKITANKATVTAKDTYEVRAKKVRAMGAGGLLELDANASLDGPKLKLTSGGAGNGAHAGPSQPPGTVPFTARFFDEFGEPIANARFHLYYDGARFEGTTGGDGTLQQPLRPVAGARVYVRIWPKDYPTGAPREYDLEWWQPVPPPHSDLGVLLRLRNLGHFRGQIPEDDPEALAGLKQEALADFMRTRMSSSDPNLQEQEAKALAYLQELHGH
ncbi:type VI secretion system Vgr family protein [Pendulispora albinea]|uniref:Phage baseplate assembly protein V n=1 Tax=Pendulispora albinea TaxID=2741071 RepID=A0ABZ2LJQ2_9BACT